MMIAEKAADIVRANTPLEPIYADFHRHRAAPASAVSDGREPAGAGEAG